jgi:hemerythrin
MLELTDDLRIGHPVIDADHQRLIEIINEFLEHSKTGDNHKLMHETLKSLLAYGREHFSREERIQRQCMYPHQAAHFHEHRALLDQVIETAREHFIAKTRPLTEASLADLNELLKSWLLGHVKKYDTGMRSWVAPPKAEETKEWGLPSPDMAALVIDSDPVRQARFAVLLQEMGASRVLAASTGLDGIGMIFGDPAPDFVICALDLAPVDGASVAGAAHFSSQGYVSKIPILLVSDTDDADVIRRALAAGAAGIFPAPFERRNLSRFLHHIMQR